MMTWEIAFIVAAIICSSAVLASLLFACYWLHRHERAIEKIMLDRFVIDNKLGTDWESYREAMARERERLERKGLR